MQLRDYQEQADKATRQALYHKDNALIVAPCAAGKTVLFCAMSKWLVDRPEEKRVLVLLDRKDLVRQTAAEIYDKTGITAGIACASVMKEKQIETKIVVASRQTLSSMMPDGYKVNLLILDEAHLVGNTGQYRTIINRLRETHPAMRVLGYTATPYRPDGFIYGKDKLFDRITYRIPAKLLLDKGYIVPLDFKVRKSDVWGQLDNCKKSGIDLNEKEQYEILKSEVFIQSVFKVYKDKCVGKKTVVFALNIAHAEAIAGVFRDNHVSARIIHSKMKSSDVKQTIKDFKNGDGVIINVGILTIGSDIPSIEAIILARRTLVTSLFFQIVGRGARLCPSINKTECLVIDMCGSVILHGWDQDDPFIHFSKGAKQERCLQLCPRCEELCGEKISVCPNCGFEFPDPEVVKKCAIAEKKSVGEIIDFDPESFVHTVNSDYAVHSYHLADGKEIPTVRIRFFSGKREICSKWACPEHSGWRPQHETKKLWEGMGGGDAVPTSVNEWIKKSDRLKKNNNIRVCFLGKYPDFRGIVNEVRKDITAEMS